MKAKILGLSLIVFVMVVTCYKNQPKERISEFMMANVEALASGETSNCSNYCKEWSGTSGGGIACDCARYSGKCKNYC